ncbi:PREDICTED: uncharacterized protein LOC108383209 [Rhagoletis zephyria]|uniref:uncharacterized protein LOC108383209 n=1 Tax=Rhagoletis zephyria TaxID=28612 RepID=UPI00081132AB|nr:PREDICTED: uncharacterized protein LOC108383209 [Rhagoletis zephyria]XP_036332361.1 uncharacterized protein LOC118743707 [Rhagoletis pomonella]
MRFPSNKTLGTIAVYGAFASITGVMYMRYKIEDRIRNSEYFRLAIQTLRQHKGAVSLLGEPIKEHGFDLSDSKNFADGQQAQFEVHVKGANDKGKMFFWATRTPEEGWFLDRLELEVRSQPDKRFLIKKIEGEKTE